MENLNNSNNIISNSIIENSNVTQINAGTININIDPLLLQAILSTYSQSNKPLEVRQPTRYEIPVITTVRDLKAIPDGGRLAALYI